jgi:hypothetical protein
LNEFDQNLTVKLDERMNYLFSFLNERFISESGDLQLLSRSLARIEEKSPPVVEAFGFEILVEKIKDLLENFSISRNDRAEKPSPMDLVGLKNIVEKKLDCRLERVVDFGNKFQLLEEKILKSEDNIENLDNSVGKWSNILIDHNEKLLEQVELLKLKFDQECLKDLFGKLRIN